MATYSSPHIDIAPWMDWKSSSTLTPARTNSTNALGMGFQDTDAGGVSGKHIEWDVALTAGTWTLTTIYLKQAHGGIATPSLDGVDLATFDSYSASLVWNSVAQVTNISVATDGIKELKYRTDTKNASSSDYDLGIIWITLTRTGA